MTDTGDGVYTVGVLVQANYGLRRNLRIAGVPVGQHMNANKVYTAESPSASETGSIIIVVATDAPLLPHQLKRIARRASLGIGRNGGMSGNGSGDIFIAFSTANEHADQASTGISVGMLANENISPLFDATIEATEEAIINALIAGRGMTGNKGHVVDAIDHVNLAEILRKYNRLDRPPQ
jgi:D-aminopeptidase